MKSKEVIIDNIQIDYNNREISTVKTLDVLHAQVEGTRRRVESVYLTPEVLIRFNQRSVLKVDIEALVARLNICYGVASMYDCSMRAAITHNLQTCIFEQSGWNQQSISYVRILLQNKAGEVFFDDVPLCINHIGLIQIAFDALLKRATEKLDIIDKEFIMPDQIILTPKAAAYFIHETIGHLCEYDYASMPGAYIGLENFNKKILNENVNIYSDPFVSDFLSFGQLDDEGNELNKQLIVENGCVKELITSMRSDSHYNNSLIRMTNIYLSEDVTGPSQDELVDRVSDAVLVDSFTNGIFHAPSNQFILHSNDAYLIKNRKKVARVSTLSINNKVTQIADMIQVIGRDMKMHLSVCVKQGQAVLVGNGSPSMLVRS